MANTAKEEGKVLQVVWDWTHPVETAYINQIRVTHGGGEFYIYLGELPFPPFLAGESIPADLRVSPRVRVAVTPEVMEVIVRVLTENLENYKKKKATTNDAS
ncbi:MAG: DUF3467 domain-containing protein [Anaerolineales bacterium]